MIKKDEGVELDLAPDFERSSSPIHHEVITIDNIGIGVVSERLHNMLKTISSITVVRVQPTEYLAACSPKTFIQCLTLTAIILREPKHLLLPGFGGFTP